MRITYSGGLSCVCRRPEVVKEYWKGDCDLRSVVDEVYDTSARLPGSKVGEILVYVGLEIHSRKDDRN